MIVRLAIATIIAARATVAVVAITVCIMSTQSRRQANTTKRRLLSKPNTDQQKRRAMTALGTRRQLSSWNTK